MVKTTKNNGEIAFLIRFALHLYIKQTVLPY